MELVDKKTRDPGNRMVLRAGTKEGKQDNKDRQGAVLGNKKTGLEEGSVRILLGAP